MTKAIVEDVRIKLASGLYEEGELFMGLIGKLSKTNFEAIVDYSIAPEVAMELKQRIAEVKACRVIYSHYQVGLRKEVVRAEAAELSGVKYSGFADNKKNLDDKLRETLRAYPTVNILELPKF